MNYYIKLGDMYIYSVRVNRTAAKTEFIEDIELQNHKDYCFKICEEEKPYYLEKICKILKIDKDKCNITFEEVEEDE